MFVQKRLAKEAKEQEKQAKIVASGKKVKELVAKKTLKSRGESSFFKVTCKVQFFETRFCWLGSSWSLKWD